MVFVGCWIPPLPSRGLSSRKGCRRASQATRSIDCFCLQRGCCQVAARVESGIDTGLLGSGPGPGSGSGSGPGRHAPPLASAAPPPASAAPGRPRLAPPPAALHAPGAPCTGTSPGSTAAAAAPRARAAAGMCPPSPGMPTAPAAGTSSRRASRTAPRRCPAGEPRVPGRAGARRCLWGTRCGGAPPDAQGSPRAARDSGGQSAAVPAAGPPRCRWAASALSRRIEDAPGTESEVCWCRELFVVSWCVFSGLFWKSHMQGQAVGWSYLCLNIASRLPMKIVSCSWKGFLVKMIWFVPPGPADFVIHCAVWNWCVYLPRVMDVVSFCKQFVFKYHMKLKQYFKREHGWGVVRFTDKWKCDLFLLFGTSNVVEIFNKYEIALQLSWI